MSDSGARYRAKQTVVNLVLALAACVALVVILVVSVPRDESNRIKEVNYSAIVDQAISSSGLKLIKISPPEPWWSNLAQLNTESADAVVNFKAGFVGSNIKYIGYTQAFDANPTWLAFQLQATTITGEYTYKRFKWEIYQSVIKNDPAKTMDYIMVLNYSKNNYVLLYGVADQKEYEAFANQVVDSLTGASQID
ncbi:MAG: DUF4245 family protein [Microbacteriaceae bacterium]|nr:DUF4245 family protein [Microbacteriaceae bacterium]